MFKLLFKFVDGARTGSGGLMWRYRRRGDVGMDDDGDVEEEEEFVVVEMEVAAVVMVVAVAAVVVLIWADN